MGEEISSSSPIATVTEFPDEFILLGNRGFSANRSPWTGTEYTRRTWEHHHPCHASRPNPCLCLPRSRHGHDQGHIQAVGHKLESVSPLGSGSATSAANPSQPHRPTARLGGVRPLRRDCNNVRPRPVRPELDLERRVCVECWRTARRH